MPARPPASLTQQLVGLGDHVHARAQPLSVDTGAIQDDAVTAAKIAADAVGSSEIAANAVTSAELATDAVVAGKIAAGAISQSADFAAGVVDSAALATGAVIQGKIAVPAVRAVWSANTSVASATDVPVAFGGTDSYDTDAMHDPTTNNTRITMPVAGVYDVGGWFEMAANAAGTRSIYVRLNGTTLIDRDRTLPAALGTGGVLDYLSIQTEYKFAANDYVELIANQNSGGALNVTGGAFYASYKTAG